MDTIIKYQELSTKLININTDEYLVKDEWNDYICSYSVTKIKLIPKIILQSKIINFVDKICKKINILNKYLTC